jgi:hypothetical protein
MQGENGWDEHRKVGSGSCFLQSVIKGLVSMPFSLIYWGRQVKRFKEESRSETIGRKMEGGAGKVKLDANKQQINNQRRTRENSRRWMDRDRSSNVSKKEVFYVL